MGDLPEGQLSDMPKDHMGDILESQQGMLENLVNMIKQSMKEEPGPREMEGAREMSKIRNSYMAACREVEGAIGDKDALNAALKKLDICSQLWIACLKVQLDNQTKNLSLQRSNFNRFLDSVISRVEWIWRHNFFMRQDRQNERKSAKCADECDRYLCAEQKFRTASARCRALGKKASGLRFRAAYAAYVAFKVAKSNYNAARRELQAEVDKFRDELETWKSR